MEVYHDRTNKLKFTPEADKQLSELENSPSKKAACKARFEMPRLY
jgi:hypothetical protein